MLAEHHQQLIGQVHGALAAPLRCSYLDTATLAPLDLPADLKPFTKEVHIISLKARSFTEPEPGEGAQGHEGPEVVSGSLQQRSHLLHRGQGHGCLTATLTRQGNAL